MLAQVLKRRLLAYKINAKTLNKCQRVLIWMKAIYPLVGQWRLIVSEKQKNDLTFQLIQFTGKMMEVIQPSLDDFFWTCEGALLVGLP